MVVGPALAKVSCYINLEKALNLQCGLRGSSELVGMGLGKMGCSLSWCVLVVCVVCYCSVWCVDADGVVGANVFIDGKSSIASTDENFICATMDWWPPEKCDYGTCSWDHSSLLNLDLGNVLFLNAIKAFSPLKIRLGGTLQDKLIYQTPDKSQTCVPFAKNSSTLFGFTEGCLPLARWDQLNSLFNRSGALVIFGLNALRGKAIGRNVATGPWDSTNAASLIRHTVSKGYKIYGWELGNELAGRGIGVGIGADQYASDTIVLHDLVQDIYKGNGTTKPLIIAPGGFFDSVWFQRFLDKTVGSLDVITQHIYNLGAGSDPHLIDRILNPTALDNGGGVLRNLHNVIKNSRTTASAWVGESGGAYNSGRNGVTNAFVFSFWYLDQLGASAIQDTKTYCRQTLIGGNYGLLNTTTFVPNPDYYSALLWHRLMGSRVLSTKFNGTRKLRTYAHCAKHSQGITLLLINIDQNTTFEAKVDFNGTVILTHNKHVHHRHRPKKIFLRHHKQVSKTAREEYHLTPSEGNIESRTMLLNGKALTVDSSGNIPALEPVRVNSSEPIRVAPYSIVFVSMPTVAIPACA